MIDCEEHFCKLFTNQIKEGLKIESEPRPFSLHPNFDSNYHREGDSPTLIHKHSDWISFTLNRKEYIGHSVPPKN